MSGHNLLIGEADAWPGRPPTLVYADDTCGLNCVFAILAALDERDRSGRGCRIDLSLYETAVSQLGPIVAERAFGAPLPERIGNADANYGLHGVFATKGHDRNIAVSVTPEAMSRFFEALGITSADEAAVTGAFSELDAGETAQRLQAAGIAAAPVADASDQTADAHLWQRGFFGRLQRRLAGIDGDYPAAGPAWGGGADVAMSEPRAVGADSRQVLREIAGLWDGEIEALYQSGAAGEAQALAAVVGDNAAAAAIGVERGELSRADAVFDGWRRASREARR
jgi:crotonobetainyl-CoA:carnitine CoA-transferase CaiB-like acyl-CoA transferase